MSDKETLLSIGHALKTAANLVAVFGHIPAGSTSEQKRAVRKQFAYLARLVHPDHVPKGSEKDAAETLNLLMQLRKTADDAIDTNTYESARIQYTDPLVKENELSSPLGTYRFLETVYRDGDFSSIYTGTRVQDGLKVLIKIASEPVYNSWLAREAIVQKRFHEAKSGSPLSRVSVSAPVLLDTFFASGEKGTQYRVNVTKHVEGLVSVEEIIQAYPHGLDPKDAAWIFRRLLAQTLAASMVGVVHSALTPDHTLVHVIKHEPLYIGWGHAIDYTAPSRKVTHIIDRYRAWYPPEVFNKTDVDHTTDIYMAGKTIIALIGGNVATNLLPKTFPEPMARLILRCVEASPARRPQDARTVLDEYTHLVQTAWGRTYRPLTMPARV